jgi:hypothetical protein
MVWLAVVAAPLITHAGHRPEGAFSGIGLPQRGQLELAGFVMSLVS